MGRSRLTLLIPLLALLALLPLIKTRVGSSNDASRLGAALSLAQSGTYALHPTCAWTHDRAQRDDGVFISDKPPLLNVMAAALARPADDSGGYRGVTFVLSTVPAVLTLLLLGVGLGRLGSPCSSLHLGVTVALTALTGLLTVYAVTFSNHCITSLLVMAMVLLMMAMESNPRGHLAMALGAVTGSLWLFDVPLGLVLFVVTALFIAVGHRPRALLFLIGATVPIAAGLALNRLLTHRWLPVYFHSDMYNYVGSVWATLPSDLPTYHLWVCERLLTMTLGSQGILVMWPVGLFALWGLLRTLTTDCPRGEVALARWTLLAWLAVMGALIFNPSARGGDLRGGFGYGLRWVIPLMAPLMLMLPRALTRLGRVGWTALSLAALWGVGVVALGVFDPWPSNTISRFPPLHNTAVALAHRGEADDHRLIHPIIAATAREPALAHFDLGMIHHRAERHDLAAAQLTRALNLAESTPTRQFDPVLARYHLGISLTEMRLFSAADEVYRELLDLAPDNIGARNNWALALLRAGRPRGALEQAQESRRRDPTSATAWYFEAAALQSLGERARATDLLTEACGRFPDDTRLRALQATLASAEQP